MNLNVFENFLSKAGHVVRRSEKNRKSFKGACETTPQNR
ncbi:hypothetical protein CAMRE0001_1383 [Campylobacter rectus RM3267]|uniref:Uncharacterized protein n=1 Tax=Campylobacter rectus RM3267 TaxID=553218 RepID=B9D069_CAMRE|nr:hypothetical protein CAMRE0001_1383 [Campylobacter rectus RM3267]